MSASVVHKYEVPFAGGAVELPEGAALAHVAIQPIGGRQAIFVWALVDPNAPKISRHIGYFGTGAPVPAGAEYVGTAVTPGGAFVWHVFEEAGS